MPINKVTTAPNGAPIAYHVLQHLQITPQGAKATVNSYAGAPVPGVQNKVIWQDAYALDPNEPSWSLASAEIWLIAEAGRFAGGTLAPEATPIQQLRAELIATAARRRNELRNVYTHDFGGELGEVAFDADPASASNINAILTAALLTSAPPEYLVNYKAHDNTYREIPLAAFQAMALGMLAFVQGLFDRESHLLDEIEAAGDDAEALMALAPVVMAFVAPVEPPPETP